MTTSLQLPQVHGDTFSTKSADGLPVKKSIHLSQLPKLILTRNRVDT